MAVAGIIAEYNPFHTGHRHQIEAVRARFGRETGVVAVMSGNWVQQARCALADKWTRAALALEGGADLVLELPTVWAVSSAESFARGGVALLQATGVVDTLSFGSECGRVEPLMELAQCLSSPDYTQALSILPQDGQPFPVRRQRAAALLVGEERAALLSQPNNNLGVEYIRALSALGSSIQPTTVARQGAGHHANAPLTPQERPPFVSATQLRRALGEEDWEAACPYLIPGSRKALEGRMAHALPERAVLARLRTMTAEDWASLPDSAPSEGLPRRLEEAGQRCTSLEEFYLLAKTRRYPHARLRRLVLWAFLGLARRDVPPAPPYLRVLGLSSRGRALLREMKGRAALPLLTKPAHAQALSSQGEALFRLEARCTDLYGLCLSQVPPGGWEWRASPVVGTEAPSL